MKYELLIFDLDGTLIDTRQDIANSANIMLAHYGLAAKTVSEVTGYVGDGISAFVERCIGGAEIPFDEAVAFFKHIYSEHLLENTTPYGGIIELLDQLEQYRKVVLTNKAYVPSKNIVDGLGLAPYFELLVGGDTLPRKKPFPDGIHHILENTGVAREKSLLVGDGKNDMLAASEARIRSVFVSWGFSDGTVAEDFSPDFRIDRPEELLKLL